MTASSLEGIEVLQVMFPDLNGVLRGKTLHIPPGGGDLDRSTACLAVLSDGLSGASLDGETSARGQGHPDVLVAADLDTVRRVPWRPGTAWCLADVLTGAGGAEVTAPRTCLRAAVTALADLGLVASVGPELEFYLVESGEHGSPGARGLRPWFGTSGFAMSIADDPRPADLVTDMMVAAAQMGLRAESVVHEFGASQYEIGMMHGAPVDAADRAALLKLLVKELARRREVLATFMAKPFQADAGSGLHFHVSLRDQADANVFDDPTSPDGLSGTARSFIAGLLEHGPALTALFCPTINSYRRMVPDAMAPLAFDWGYDNRTTWVRVPFARGRSTRIEMRAGDASANIHLAMAAMLHAGADGIRRGLQPPAAGGHGPPRNGDEPPSVPRTLARALKALHDDAVLVGLLGERLVGDFTAAKEIELSQHWAAVSDWEIREYLEKV